MSQNVEICSTGCFVEKEGEVMQDGSFGWLTVFSVI
jgi:hypothetical protein